MESEKLVPTIFMLKGYSPEQINDLKKKILQSVT